ncbi:unnamed protein product [Protopolystoma xenopodis]|uniref:Uncharacterized protein n=1 Tax=Protopolystoma xenopodis TaxID=117903 RepID=A0A3S4ZXV3_9PLAT|nr:unnamed protein product [Protopolystoma xenopodis]
MDAGDHTQAVLFFFLGHHLSTRFQLSCDFGRVQDHQLPMISRASDTSCGNFPNLPIYLDANLLVKRQCITLGHMEVALSTACRKRLACPPASIDAALYRLLDVVEQCANNSIFEGSNVQLKNPSAKNLVYSKSPLHLPIRQKMYLVNRLLSTAMYAVLLLFLSPSGNVSERTVTSASGKVRPCSSSTDVNGVFEADEKSVEKLYLPSGLTGLLKGLTKWRPKNCRWLKQDRLYSSHLPEDVTNYCIDLSGLSFGLGAATEGINVSNSRGRGRERIFSGGEAVLLNEHMSHGVEVADLPEDVVLIKTLTWWNE